MIIAIPAVCPSGIGHAGRLGEDWPGENCPECIWLQLATQVRSHRDVYNAWAHDKGRSIGPSLRMSVRDRMLRAMRADGWPSP